MFLPEKLRECREEKKLSVEILTIGFFNFGLKIAGNTIRNWEAGTTEPNANQLDLIAKFFKKPIKFFYN